MALPASGTITLLQIATEFGGTTPHSLSEYYAAAAGVPASGTISFSDFYGKSASDPNPDAVNWADITGDADGSAKTNANQTISGIDVTITITASNSGGASLSYSKNNGGFTAYTGGISMANGDTLRWGVASASGAFGTITVTNATTGTTLDTFTYDLLEPL